MVGGDYLLPIGDLRASFVNDPLFTYRPSEQIVVKDGASLGEVYDPYFDRRPQHFSGHVNAPSKPEASGFAAGSEKGNFIYLAHPIFSCYHQAGAVAMLEIAENTINRALGRTKLVTTSLSRAGRVTVRSQPVENRDIVHLLHATPALRGNLRGANIQPIQDIITLRDISVSLSTRSKVKAVRSVPDLRPLAFTEEAQRVSFVVPELSGHAMVEVAYE
jgi:hypothetical protein